MARVVIARTEEPEPRTHVVLILHHFIADRFSCMILFEEFVTAYEALARGERIPLARGTASLQEYASRLTRLADSGAAPEPPRGLACLF